MEAAPRSAAPRARKAADYAAFLNLPLRRPRPGLPLRDGDPIQSMASSRRIARIAATKSMNVIDSDAITTRVRLTM
jgi:hypothetical protein